MILKALLKKIIRHVLTNPDEHGSQCLIRGAASLGVSVETMIMNVQPRDIGVLRDYVPLAFPKELRSGPLAVTQNIHEKWRVDPLERRKHSRTLAVIDDFVRSPEEV